MQLFFHFSRQTKKIGVTFVLAMLGAGQLVIGVTLWKLRLNPRADSVGFVMEKLLLG